MRKMMMLATSLRGDDASASVFAGLESAKTRCGDAILEVALPGPRCSPLTEPFQMRLDPQKLHWSLQSVVALP